MNIWSLTWLVAGKARGGRARLVGTAAGVAVGVALLLLVLGSYQGMSVRTERSTWTQVSSGVIADTITDDEVLATSTLDRHTPDWFAGNEITRVDIAATPGSTVDVPGIGRAPDPGTYYASPALAEMIADAPSDQLRERYGTPAGTISHDALASPDSLVVVVGGTVDQLVAQSASVVSEFGGFAYPNNSYRVVAIIGGFAILFPVVVLISIVSRLGQAVRAERFAALRLIGATPHRVAVVSALETGTASLLGAVGGVGLYWLLVPLAARLPLEDGSFFVDDLRVSPGACAAVVGATALITAFVAYVTVRRADVGPLGASRERRERRPRLLAAVPLLVGLAAMVGTAVAAATGWNDRVDDGLWEQWCIFVFIGGFVLVALGVTLAGPILTAWAARLGARWTRSAAGVLAVNRIRQHPRATFRSVSGLVLAVFVVTVFAASISLFEKDALAGGSPDQRISPTALVGTVDIETLMSRFASQPSGAPSPDGDLTQADIDALTAAVDSAARTVAATDGVTDVIVTRAHPDDSLIISADDATRLGLTVPDGAEAVQVADDYFVNYSWADRPVVLGSVPSDVVARSGPGNVIVVTDGTVGAQERARTAMILAIPLTGPPETRAEDASSDTSWAASYARLANIGILIATAICAVSLTVATASGVLDRRRVLGLLRLQGMPPSTLRWMLLAEAAVPIAAVLALCVGLGFTVAWSIIAGLTNGEFGIGSPGADYYVTLAVSLALAFAAVVATFRTARTSTSIAATRFE
ncbi:MAG: FtsX-like permease family protein [Cellulomonas sp.]|jgi:ABC-type antimicrobial peptide transport system permease subunit|nr:FtsX-like permease family protein [Cellulomonas sp.]